MEENDFPAIKRLVLMCWVFLFSQLLMLMNLNSVAIMSATINSATNFLLYCAFSSGFRKTFLEVLHIRSTGEFLMFERRKRLLVNIAVKVEQMII